MAETRESSGKPSKAGIYPVCHGAMCKCDQAKVATTLGELEVKTQTTVYINDKDGAEKLVATTKDLPLPFKVKASTFSQCLKQPMGPGMHKECVPNITEWGKSYEAIKLSNQGTALIKESEGICSFGGKITFETHGQTQTVTLADVAATPEEVGAMLTDNMLTEEELSKLASGTFDDTDDETIGVKDIVTTDSQSPVKSTYTYHNEHTQIQFKASRFTQSGVTNAQKAGINWVVYEKQKNNAYKELYTFVDKGDIFDFPYRTTGIYAVEAYGKSKTFNVNTGRGGAYNLVHIKFQELANSLKLTVAGQDRTVVKRIRPTEIAVISAGMLFPDATPLKPKNIYWEVTSGGNTVEFSKIKGAAQISIPPQNNTATKTLTVKASCNGISATPLTFKVGANYVKSISADKETICVLNQGEQEKERHKVTFSVASYAIEPASEAEKTLVKWIAYHDEPKIENQIGTGDSFTKTSQDEGSWYVEAYVNSPEGIGKPTTKQLKAIQPKITKAYWADKNSNSISKSGYGHQVYIHIETEGLQGEKLQLKVWESQKGNDTYIENAGTEIEITQANGVVNQAFTIPDDKKAGYKENYKYEFFFTIEKLDYEVQGTQQDDQVDNQYILIPDGKVKYLDVTASKRIVSLKIHETGNKLHTGIVKYGDAVTIRVSTRNLIDEELEFEIWEDIKIDNHTNNYSMYDTWDDKNTKSKIEITIDNEGNGEATFTIPSGWESDHKDLPQQPRYFYLRYKAEEFPRAYYIQNPNKTEEENKKNSNRIRALMLKVAKDDVRDGYEETNNAVILGEELKLEQNNGETCDPLIWGEKFTCEERKKLLEICTELWGEDKKIKMANNLMAVFAWESGGTFKTNAPNMGNSGGTGLIQFMPKTAKSLLGKDITIEYVKDYWDKDKTLKRVKEFANMTVVEQLDYVKKYFKPQANKDLEFVDFYLQVLFPASSGKKDHVVFSKDGEGLDVNDRHFKLRVKAYAQNSGMDADKNGKLMKNEIALAVQKYITKGKPYKNDCTDGSCTLSRNKHDGQVVGNCLDTWDHHTNTRISLLHSDIQCMAKNFINEVENTLSIKLRVVSGYRSFSEQTKLYNQGRTTSGSVVTNAKAGQSYHNYGVAIDVCQIKDNQAIWDESMYKKIAPIGKKWGFDWGGDWTSFVDMPHFEYTNGKSTSDLLKLYNENNEDYTKIKL